MREPVTMRFPVCFPASCFSALLTTPETWLHTCRKMVLHGFTLIVSQSVLCCPSFSSVTRSQNRAAYAYAIRRRSGHMLCKSSFEGAVAVLLGGTCSDISIKFCSAIWRCVISGGFAPRQIQKCVSNFWLQKNPLGTASAQKSMLKGQLNLCRNLP